MEKKFTRFSLIFWVTQVLIHSVYSAYKDSVALDIYTSFLHQSTPLGQCSKGNKKKNILVYSHSVALRSFLLVKRFHFSLYIFCWVAFSTPLLCFRLLPSSNLPKAVLCHCHNFKALLQLKIIVRGLDFGTAVVMLLNSARCFKGNKYLQLGKNQIFKGVPLRKIEMSPRNKERVSNKQLWKKKATNILEHQLF